VRVVPRGLRARTVGAFALLALVLSVTLSVATYQLARYYLLGQREALATRQVMLNAAVARGLLAAGDADPDEAVDGVRAASNARSVLRIDGTWYAAVVELNETTIPQDFIRAVDEGRGAVRQRVVVGGTPYVLVGIALPGLPAAYFEFVQVEEYRRTLETLAAVLVAAGSLTTIAGAAAGWFASRRLLRPLTDVALAARAMSRGELSRRMEVEHDPDLAPVARSFNEMAESLEARIARELRFTADVSHELRTPLTAMAAAVSLAQRADLPGRARFAVEVLDEQVEQLRRLTLELLEISRIDAGVSHLERREVDVVELVTRTLSAMGLEPPPVSSQLGSDRVHALDPTRVERVLANLVENAQRYGGGVTCVELRRDGTDLLLIVDDDGPGVPDDERVAIFGRFHRGVRATAEGPDVPKGTGLGLSLVDEHVKLHGGSVTVGESPGGGARFVVRLPAAGGAEVAP